jgi:UPF0716 protein FxsA
LTVRRLLAVSAILLAIEVVVLIAIGQAIGVAVTLGLVAITSAIGAVLLVTEGRRAWRSFRADFNERRPWGNAALDALLVLVGTVLIVVPGFVSDVLGLLLVLPPTRRLARIGVLRAYGGRLSPADMTTLFGPRRVRARPGPAVQRPGPPASREQMVDGGEPIEGEIIQ